MIYPYKILDHPINQFHEDIGYFFIKLFEEEPLKFNSNNLLPSKLKPLTVKYKSKLLNRMKKIHRVYITLSPRKKAIIKIAFINNNSIHELCHGKKIPVQYFEIDAKIRNLLYEFNKELWEIVLGYKEVQNKYGTVIDHFEKFIDEEHQEALICPFCDLNPLLTAYDAKDGNRNDYDHYLPKKLYPFSSVNFLNLSPMCSECNKTYKSQKDPLYQLKNKKLRRKIFFPYDTKLINNIISAKINSNEADLKSSTNNWSIELNDTQNNRDELDSWDSIFEIRSRYKNRILAFSKIWSEYFIKEYDDALHDKLKLKNKLLDRDIVEPMRIPKKAFFEYALNLLP